MQLKTNKQIKKGAKPAIENIHNILCKAPSRKTVWGELLGSFIQLQTNKQTKKVRKMK
jgi:hypothetical protein